MCYENHQIEQRILRIRFCCVLEYENDAFLCKLEEKTFSQFVMSARGQLLKSPGKRSREAEPTPPEGESPLQRVRLTPSQPERTALVPSQATPLEVKRTALVRATPGQVVSLSTPLGSHGTVLSRIVLPDDAKTTALTRLSSFEPSLYQRFDQQSRQNMEESHAIERKQTVFIDRNASRDLYGPVQDETRFATNASNAYTEPVYSATSRMRPTESYVAADAPRILRLCISKMLPTFAFNYAEPGEELIYSWGRVSDIHGFNGMALAVGLDAIVLPTTFINTCENFFRFNIGQSQADGRLVTSGLHNAMKLLSMEGLLNFQKLNINNNRVHYDFIKKHAIDGASQMRDLIQEAATNGIQNTNVAGVKANNARLSTLAAIAELDQFQPEQSMWFNWSLSDLTALKFGFKDKTNGDLTVETTKLAWAREIGRVKLDEKDPAYKTPLVGQHSQCAVLARVFELHKDWKPIQVLSNLLAEIASEFSTGGYAVVYGPKGKRTKERRSHSSLLDFNHQARVVYANIKATEAKNTSRLTVKEDQKVLIDYWKTYRKAASDVLFYDARDCFFRNWASEHTRDGAFVPYMRAFEVRVNKETKKVTKVAHPNLPKNLSIDALIVRFAAKKFMEPGGMLNWKFAQFAWALIKSVVHPFTGLRDLKPLFDYIGRMIDQVWEEEIANDSNNRAALHDVISPIILAVCFRNRPLQLMSIYALWTRFALYLRYLNNAAAGGSGSTGGAVTIDTIIYPHEHEGKDSDRQASKLLLDAWKNDYLGGSKVSDAIISGFMAGVWGHAGVKYTSLADSIAREVNGLGSDPTKPQRVAKLLQNDNDRETNRAIIEAGNFGYGLEQRSILGTFIANDAEFSQPLVRSKRDLIRAYIAAYKFQGDDTRYESEFEADRAKFRKSSSAPPAESRQRIIGVVQENSVGIVAPIFRPVYELKSVVNFDEKKAAVEKKAAEEKKTKVPDTQEQREWIYPDGTRRFTFAGPGIDKVDYGGSSLMAHMDLNVIQAAYDADYAALCMTPATADGHVASTDTDGTRESILEEELRVSIAILGDIKEREDKANQAKDENKALDMQILYNEAYIYESEMSAALNVDPKRTQFRVHPDRLFWDVFCPREPDVDWRRMLDSQNILQIITTLARNADTMQITFHMINSAGDAFIVQDPDILTKIQGMLWARFGDVTNARTGLTENGDTKNKRQITRDTSQVLTPINKSQMGAFLDILELADAAQDKSDNRDGIKDTWRAHNYRLVKSCILKSILVRRSTLSSEATDLPHLPWIRERGDATKIIKQAQQFDRREGLIALDMRAVVQFMQSALVLEDHENDEVPIPPTPMITSVGQVLDKLNATTLLQNVYSALNYKRDFRFQLLQQESDYYDMRMRRIATRIQKLASQEIKFELGTVVLIQDMGKMLEAIFEPFRINGKDRVSAFLINTDVTERVVANLQSSLNAPRLDPLLSASSGKDEKKTSEVEFYTKVKGSTSKRKKAKLPPPTQFTHPLFDRPDILKSFVTVARTLVEACNILFTDMKYRQVARIIAGESWDEDARDTEEEEDKTFVQELELDPDEEGALASIVAELQNKPKRSKSSGENLTAEQKIRKEFTSDIDFNPHPDQKLTVFALAFNSRIRFLVKMYHLKFPAKERIHLTDLDLQACSDMAGRYIYPVVRSRTRAALLKITREDITDTRLVLAAGSSSVFGNLPQLTAPAPEASPETKRAYAIMTSFFAAFYEREVVDKILVLDEMDDLQSRVDEYNQRQAAVTLKELDTALEQKVHEQEDADLIEYKQREISSDDEKVLIRFNKANEEVADLTADAGEEENKLTGDLGSVFRQLVIIPLNVADLNSAVDWFVTTEFWKQEEFGRGMSRAAARLRYALTLDERKAWSIPLMFEHKPVGIYNLLGEARCALTLGLQAPPPNDNNKDLANFQQAAAGLILPNAWDNKANQTQYLETYKNVRACILNHTRFINFFDDIFRTDFKVIGDDHLSSKLNRPDYSELIESTEKEKNALAPQIEKKNVVKGPVSDKKIELSTLASAVSAEVTAQLVRNRNRSKTEKYQTSGSEEKTGIDFMVDVLGYPKGDSFQRARACVNALQFMYDRWDAASPEGLDIDQAEKDANNKLLLEMKKVVEQGWRIRTTSTNVRLDAIRKLKDLVLRHSAVFFTSWLVPVLNKRKEQAIQNARPRREFERKEGKNRLGRLIVDLEGNEIDENDLGVIDARKASDQNIRLAQRCQKRLMESIDATFGLTNLLGYLSEVYDGFDELAPSLALAADEYTVIPVDVKAKMDTSEDVQGESDSDVEQEETDEELPERARRLENLSAATTAEYQRIAEAELDIENRSLDQRPVELNDRLAFITDADQKIIARSQINKIKKRSRIAARAIRQADSGDQGEKTSR